MKDPGKEQLTLIAPAERLSIQEAEPPEELEIIPAKTGDSTLRYRGLWFHSRYDPRKEAQRQLSDLTTQNDSRVLFFGAGLGYVVHEFLESFEDGTAIWLEPDRALLRMALAELPFANPRPERLKILAHHPSEEELQDLFRGCGNRQVRFVAHRPSFTSSEDYLHLLRRCESFLNRKDVNLATMSRFDRLWARNLVANFSHLPGGRPVSRLFGTARGRRALVCGAGPTLSESIFAIEAMREQVVLIAVDTALHVLKKHGIDPDYVISVDPQALNCHYLRGYEGQACFVVDPTTTYLSLRQIPEERLFYTWSPFPLARLLFEGLDGSPGEIAFGGSVSTNAYDFAIQLGCTSVILAGQDLAFVDGLAHVRGALLEERLGYLESRTFRRELHNHRQLHALPAREMLAFDGSAWRGNDKLVIFRDWFARRVPLDVERGIKVYTLSQRGTSIAGVQPTTHNHLESREPKRKDFAPAAHIYDIDAFYQRLAALRKDLVSYEVTLARAYQLAEDVLGLTESGNRGREYDDALRRLEDAEEKVRADSSLSEIAGSMIQRIIFQITENTGEDDLDDDPHVAASRKSVLLFGGLLESTRDYVRWLDHVIAIQGN